jgi:hypothetical protein
MKRLLVPMLFAPGVAMAGLVIVSDGAAKGDHANKQQLIAKLEAQKMAPAAPAAPAVPVVEIEQWEIKAGASLRTTLENWCDRSGYRLVWNVEGGYRSQGGFVSEGDFKKAVKALFAAIPQDLHLDVDITKNKLVIVSRVSK